MDIEKIKKEIRNAVNRVKKENPIAPSVTNTVTINFVANAQLAVGGSAAMVYLPDEAESLARIAKSFYINVGTFFPIYCETLPHVAKVCCEEGKPWVLDPVAIGVGGKRSEVLGEVKKYPPKIVRGNASEIIALAEIWDLTEGKKSNANGVETGDKVEDARESAECLASFINGAVAVSGETDLVTDGKLTLRSFGGSKFLPMVTGAGCSLGGVASVYAAVASPFIAALTATSIYNLAAKRAEKNSKGPGSFEKIFLDELYLASAEDISNNPMEVE